MGVLTALLLALQAAPTAPVPAARAVTLPFTYHERLILVGLGLQDGERLFLLDTGASASALDARVAKELALPRAGTVEVEGTAGVVEVESARLPALHAGSLAIEGLTVTLQDLGAIPCPAEERVAGILGFDFLGRFVVELDYLEHRLTLSARALEPRESALALELDNGIPRFAAQLDDLPLELRIDTGASLFASTDVYVNITTATWAELCRADPALAPEGHLSGAGLGGKLELPFARIQALLVGETALARPYVIVQPRAGYFARDDAVGFVGNNFLEKFEQVTLDYPGRKLRLGPREP